MTPVLYICPSSGIGGAETFIKGTWRHADRNQFECHYLLFSDGPLAKDLKAAGAPVTVLDFKPRLSQLSSHRKVTGVIKKLIAEHDISIVHSTMAYGALFAAWACWQTGTKHIWFQHGPASGWMDRMAGTLPHQMVIANSKYTMAQQKKLESPVSLLVPKTRKSVILTLGTEQPELSESEINQMRREILDRCHIQEPVTLVSMLCRLQKWKGVHVFLKALERIPNENVIGLVWGESFKDDGYLDKLKKMASEKNIPVHFMGSTDYPQLALAASDILVNASIQPEPFGLSIIEALAVGTPVVVPNEGGPSEIMKNAEMGYVFESRNDIDLADKIAALAKSIKSSNMAQTCQRQAHEHFNVTTTIRNLENFYREVIRN